MDLQPRPDRRPARLCDQALTGTTRLWLRRMPWRERPLALCERFPHVANRLAWCWNDAQQREQVFEDLLSTAAAVVGVFPPRCCATWNVCAAWGADGAFKRRFNSRSAQTAPSSTGH